MKIHSYLRLARLNQLTGIWLLFLPCLFGIFLSIKKLPDPDFIEILRIIFLFLLGSIIMRSAGCVLNDLIDQKFDEQVARTKNRPLVTKEISRSGAAIFLALLLIVGFSILLQFNRATILSGFVALALIVAYPLMKRITNYPQIFLGLTFNFGILMTSLAILENIDLDAIILFLAAIIWTLIYDSIYAFQDIVDDLKIGVKSSAIKFQKDPKKVLFFLNLAMLTLLILLGWHTNFKSEFFLSALLASMFLDYKIKTCDFQNPANCLKVFKSNIWVGILINLAILLG